MHTLRDGCLVLLSLGIWSGCGGGAVTPDAVVAGDLGAMAAPDLSAGAGGDLATGPALNCDDTPLGADDAEDPLFPLQWHIKNSKMGLDLHNVSDAWALSRGAGVLVSVVDDGVDIGHEDLKINVRKDASLNFWAGVAGFAASDKDPTPQFPEAKDAPAHGTAVAGLVMARDLNGVGIKGIAPRACVAGVNLIATGGNTGIEDARAMNHNLTTQAISNNSWGATDGLGGTDGTSKEWLDAIEKGVAMGRGGKGTVYVWAAGNGARTADVQATGFETDNSNYDAQANYHSVIAVGGVMDDGKRVNYSERGANLWVCGFSETTDYGNTNTGTTTTDIAGTRGYNKRAGAADPKEVGIEGNDYKNGHYTQGFNGTSSAAPTVAGVVALMLGANPNLGWRDVRLILARTARKTDGQDAGWTTNKATPPLPIHHGYGFGLVDAEAAVKMARTWMNVGPQETPYDSMNQMAKVAFKDNDPTGASHTIKVAGNKIKHLEFVEVWVTASGDIGDLDLRLTGSLGTESRLAEPHNCFAMKDAPMPKQTCQMEFNNWRFGSARHLGEPADQDWTLKVSDRRAGHSAGGELTSWRLALHGTN